MPILCAICSSVRPSLAQPCRRISLSASNHSWYFPLAMVTPSLSCPFALDHISVVGFQVFHHSLDALAEIVASAVACGCPVFCFHLLQGLYVRLPRCHCFTLASILSLICSAIARMRFGGTLLPIRSTACFGTPTHSKSSPNVVSCAISGIDRKRHSDQ